MNIDRQLLKSDIDDVETDLEVGRADAVLGKYNKLKAKVKFNL